MRRFVLGFSFLFTACAATPDPQSKDTDDDTSAEGGACVPVARQVLGVDEVSPTGFSARAAVDAASGEHTAPLRWAGGAESTLTTTVVVGEIAWVDSEYQSDGSGMEPAIGCLDALELAATVGLHSADGAFAEELSTVIVVSSDGVGALSVDVTGPLAGTFDVLDHVPAGAAYDEVSAWMSLTFDAAGLSGAVEGQGSGTDGEVAWAEMFEIATVGTPAP